MSDVPAILSFGGGVQTRAAVRFILAGEMERPDRVVFADTGEEPAAIYRGVAEDKRALAWIGIPLDVVADRGRLGDAMIAGPGVFAPVFTTSAERPEGRFPFKTCTGRFKREPITRHLKALGLKKWRTWLGYTTDEIERVKPSGNGYSTNEFPLIDLNIRRSDAEAINNAAGIENVKSSCVFCPLHSSAMWRTVATRPRELERAIEVDEAIRDREPSCRAYVHRERRPLAEVALDLSAQPSLFGEDCEDGYCGT